MDRIYVGADLSGHCYGGGGTGGSDRAPAGSANDDHVGASVDDQQDSADYREDGGNDTEDEGPGQVTAVLVYHKYQNS